MSLADTGTDVLLVASSNVIIITIWTGTSGSRPYVTNAEDAIACEPIGSQ
jgi:hypothetical protein